MYIHIYIYVHNIHHINLQSEGKFNIICKHTYYYCIIQSEMGSIADILSAIHYLISLSIIEIIKVSIYVSIKAKIVSNIGIYYNRVLN